MSKKKVVSRKKFRIEKSKTKKNISPVLMSLCIFLLLLIILPIATIMWYSGGTEIDVEYGTEKDSVNIEKEENYVDTSSMNSRDAMKSPAIYKTRQSSSSINQEDRVTNQAVIPEEETTKEDQEVPIETTQDTNEMNPVPPESVPEYHTVEEGEGLWRIAKNNNLTLEEIKTLNNLTSDVIQVGQTLLVKK
ncbi:LysM peptidoglycan-binding domain-containing protein [Carnobacterium maltaromaticum]|uniref:LysM peptidoglycan-binding domain-containing protein n=1 Tax=Carnobacterium maltaromaticum TaxID=2751 RepID=UPI00295F106A|nr:LysM peptidoglycan-binding domain-containing protein [Carnobacterium maltaromaticum]